MEREREWKRNKKDKKRRRELWRREETHRTPLEVKDTQSLLFRSTTKMRESSIYSGFPVSFLIHTIHITLCDQGEKIILYKNIPADN